MRREPKSRKTFLYHPFTLLEVVAVLAVMSVVLGLVIPTIGHLPAFVSLDNCAGNMTELLQDAGTRSLLQGKTMEVEGNRNPESGNWVFSMSKGERADFIYAGKVLKAEIPESIDISFPGLRGLDHDGKVKFMFFPDGTAAGPETLLEHRGHRLAIGVSPLTGLVYRRELE